MRADPVARQRLANFGEGLIARASGLAVGASWEADICRPYSRFAREAQKEPELRDEPLPSPWQLFLFRTGRGVGKTWSLNGIAIRRIKAGIWKRIAAVSGTQDDVRKTIVEHPACGILAMAQAEGIKALWHSTRLEVSFPQFGAVICCYSAEKPDRLSGPSHDGAIIDELRSWRNLPSVYSMLEFGLRLGQDPQIVGATNPPRAGDDPRNMKFLQQLEARSTTFTQTGSSRENLANLSPSYRRNVIEAYEGTSIGKTEIEGEYAKEIEGSLWKRESIEKTRISFSNGQRETAIAHDGPALMDGEPFKIPEMMRVAIGVDPHGGADEAGIIAAGLGEDGRLYVFADGSTSGGVNVWPRRVVSLFDQVLADRVVAEVNFGGDMVKGVLDAAAADGALPVEVVHASRGKYVRAEPVAALWENGRASIVGALPELEDEMCIWTPESKFSPNRLDAMVWAATWLVLGPRLMISKAGEGLEEEEDGW